MPRTLGTLLPEIPGMRPATGGSRDERRTGQERGEQAGRNTGLEPVGMAA
jgi:hypothetical protein